MSTLTAPNSPPVEGWTPQAGGVVRAGGMTPPLQRMVQWGMCGTTGNVRTAKGRPYSYVETPSHKKPPKLRHYLKRGGFFL